MREIYSLYSRITLRFGLQPRREWRGIVLQTIDKIARQDGISADAALAKLSGNSLLLRELAERLTVDESFFFRHVEHFLHLRAITAEALPSRVHGRHFTIWCAGCSRGEEPLSVAITLYREFGAKAREVFSILGNDLSRSAIQKARRGLYSAWSFRGVEDATRKAFFTSLADGRYLARQQIRDMCRFDHCSIQDRLARLPEGSLHAIFFRNVALYLDSETNRRVYHGIARLLAPGGVLYVSALDPRPPEGLFDCADSRNEGVYRVSRGKTARSSHPALDRDSPLNR